MLVSDGIYLIFWRHSGWFNSLISRHIKMVIYWTICVASIQNPQHVTQNEMEVILDYNLISLNKL